MEPKLYTALCERSKLFSAAFEVIFSGFEYAHGGRSLEQLVGQHDDQSNVGSRDTPASFRRLQWASLMETPAQKVRSSRDSLRR